MKAICTGCGIEIQFEPEKRGLMEKCGECGEIFPLEPPKGLRHSKDPNPAQLVPARLYLRKVRSESNYDELRTMVGMVSLGLKIAAVFSAIVVLFLIYQVYSVATAVLVDWSHYVATRGSIPVETAQMLSRAQHIADIVTIVVGICSVAYILGFGFFLASVVYQSFSVGIDIADMTAEQGARRMG